MEIYNEMLRDLLGHDPSSKLDIKQGREGLFVPGLVEIDVRNVDEVNEVRKEGFPPSMNRKIWEDSSRVCIQEIKQ